MNVCGKLHYLPDTNEEPQTLTVRGKNKSITLENILIGDVWVLGGQSNMEEPLQHVENGRQIVSANYPGIRVLTIPAQNGADYKQGFARLRMEQLVEPTFP